MFGLGIQELLIIFVILIFLFGAKKLPELAKGLGSGIRDFKKAVNEEPAPEPEKKQIQPAPESEKRQMQPAPELERK